MSRTASSVLDMVEEDLRRRFAYPTSPAASLPSTSLSLLTPADWAAVMSPLAPDTHPARDAAASELMRYVQVRCAELPMRLQMEALQTRRYEHLLRQHMRELVTLSEYVALVSRTPPTLAPAPRSVSEAAAQQPQPAGAASLPTDLSLLLSPEEVPRRLDRAEERVKELEAMVRLDAVAKVQCCQRMVLLSEYVRALLRRVRHGSTATAVAGAKRDRSGGRLEAEEPS